MSSATTDRYQRVLERAAELSDLNSMSELLGWDQETKMPTKGVEGRSHVSATIAGIMHEKINDPGLGEDLNTLAKNGQDLDDIQKAQVREFLRVHRRQTRLPAALVKTLAELESRATATWAQARTDKDFASFAPLLEEMIRLKKEVAEAIGYKEEPYEALLDEYEPGTPVKEVERILGELRDYLVPIVRRIAESAGDPPAMLAGPFETAAQDRFGRRIIKAMGFDMNAGRLDFSQHPFTSGIHEGDTRLTTRYKEGLTVGLFGTMHETGHGLYEQNFSPELRRTPLGGDTSLGIHESQSRLWENMVGRGRSFWKQHYPELQKDFPDQVGSVSLDDFYRAVNDVRPSFIRIEADEITYNLHIVLRFELEREMISGRLAVADVPGAWNDKVKEYLGVTPPSPDVGVLQDIHWSAGYIGYFPTYSLGNVYAAQFYAAAGRDIPDLEDRIAAGDLITLRDWLVEKIHRHGRRYSPQELVEQATGEKLKLDYFRDYIQGKFGPLYGI